jgi:predicted O-methyltransferase YrrM
VAGHPAFIMWNPAEISEDWLKSHSSSVSKLLEEIEQDTAERFPSGAHMLSGFSQGRLLSLFSRLLKPSRILEIGTFTGYGSLCLAEGLAPEGKLISLEKNEEYVKTAKAWFARSPFEGRIFVLQGNAAELLINLQEQWDLVYLDADKAGNKEYLQRLWANINQGGLVIIDNVFARGAILKPEKEQRNFEKSVGQLNHELPTMFPDARQFILPLRDGLSILQKTI